MRVLLFGASGMVGQGVLRECLLDPGVTSALAIVRSPLESRDPKLHELRHENFLEFEPITAQMASQAGDGIRSKTALHRAMYRLTAPLFPTLRRLAPDHVTTTEEVARAMLKVAYDGSVSRVIGNREIRALAAP